MTNADTIDTAPRKVHRAILQFHAPSVTSASNKEAYAQFGQHFAGQGFLSGGLNESNRDSILKNVLSSVPEADRIDIARRYIGPLKHTVSGVEGIITRTSDAHDQRFFIRLFHENPFVLRSVAGTLIESLNEVNKPTTVIFFPLDDDKKVHVKKPCSKENVCTGMIVENNARRKEIQQIAHRYKIWFVIALAATLGLHGFSTLFQPAPAGWIEHLSQHFGRFSTVFGAGWVVSAVSLKTSEDLQDKLKLHWHD